MAHLLVSVGTDGLKDWVRTPDGQKHNLGTHSVLSFVTKLAKNRKVARAVLNDFLRGSEAMLSVDEGMMWDLLAHRRALWASDSDGPFMPRDQRHQFMASGGAQGTPEMITLASLLDEADKALAYINKNASANRPLDPNVFKHLASISERMANQSSNSEFYGMPASPKPDKPEEGFANDETSPAGMVEMNKSASDLTIDVYEANLKTAKTISDQTRATAVAINKLAANGKKFNSVRALADVSKVAGKVASICEKTALTEEWVTDDLSKLASESRRLYGLFHPKKA